MQVEEESCAIPFRPSRVVFGVQFSDECQFPLNLMGVTKNDNFCCALVFLSETVQEFSVTLLGLLTMNKMPLQDIYAPGLACICLLQGDEFDASFYGGCMML